MLRRELKQKAIVFHALLLVGCNEIPRTDSITSVCEDDLEQMVVVKGGEVILGKDPVYPEERASSIEIVEDFLMSKYEVTNKQFKEFVAETGYITLAERALDSELYPNAPKEFLSPGSAVFAPDVERLNGEKSFNWWRFTPGANWRHPEGPDSSIEGKDYYPVVHMALEDAKAFAEWKGHRLPTEAEFELAANINNAVQSKKPKLQAPANANTWQGNFPFENTKIDGFSGTAPVGCYDPGINDIHDLIGNVWEWTQTPYFISRQDSAYEQKMWPNGRDPNQPGVAVSVVKGGSYLCSPDFCMRYRPAARIAQDTGLGTNHIGFRTVRSLTDP